MDTRTASRTQTTFCCILGAGFVLAPRPASALDPFVDGSAQLVNDNLKSGVAIGVTDMNGDGLDDIVRFDDADDLEIEFQQPDGSFSRYVYGGLPGSSQWAVALADVDGNGYVDIYTGGSYNGHKILRANDVGDAWQLEVINQPDVFTQCANFADIDNDGAVDLFVCHDDGLSAPFGNDGMGGFTHAPALIDASSTIPSDNSGNYGSVWSDYDSDGDLDLYIAKCRLFVDDPLDGRRVNLLFQNDGNNNFTDVAEAVGLRPLAQSWSIDFGDIDNDGDMDAFIINHDMVSQLYLNQGPGAGQGTFVDITNAAGMSADLLAIDLGIQGHFTDFDNDTFLDLLVTGREGVHRLFLNNGDNTFTAEPNPFPTGGLGVHSAAVGDLNADGFQDVVAGFATGFNNASNLNSDRLFLNPGNTNNWLDVRLTGVVSNPSAIGARVELHGPWGVMIREVRGGEGYGITNSFIKHFGLGAATAIDTVIVRWPSGQVDQADNPNVLNETVHIVEGCPGTWYADADGDGYGDPADAVGGCLPPQGYVGDDNDCDDAEGESFPGNPELCDEIDNNCNGEVDEIDCEPGTTGSVDSTGGDTTSSTTTGVVDSSGGTTTGPGPITTASGGSTGSIDPSTTGEASTGGDAGAADEGGGGGGGCKIRSGSGGGASLLLLGLLLGIRRRRSALSR